MRAGDTLSGIAKKYNTTVDLLRRYNPHISKDDSGSSFGGFGGGDFGGGGAGSDYGLLQIGEKVKLDSIIAGTGLRVRPDITPTQRISLPVYRVDVSTQYDSLPAGMVIENGRYSGTKLPETSVWGRREINNGFTTQTRTAQTIVDDWNKKQQGGSDIRANDLGLLMPVSLGYRVTSGFTLHERYIPSLNQRSPHDALDIGTPVGTPIKSPWSGEVTDARTAYYGQYTDKPQLPKRIMLSKTSSKVSKDTKEFSKVLVS